MSRPELQQPPELFYDETEARKYHASSRMVQIQAEIASRAIELLALPEGKTHYILDIGCGSGLSGQALEDAGHHWLGFDISPHMLRVAQEADTTNGDLLYHDMGLGLPFRPASFDGAISISALQWLCYSESSDQVPRARLMRFFSSLYTVLKRSARAILQFYPQNVEQAMLIASCATRVGFAGGLLVDFPNSTKAKKYYLCLSFERGYTMPKALGIDDGGVVSVGRETKQRTRGKRVSVKSRDWILQKKERDRKRGKEVRPDSKYTGRKRKSAL